MYGAHARVVRGTTGGIGRFKGAGAVLAVGAALLATTVAVPVLGQDSRGPYGVTVMKDVMVPMRDGVRLATDVYLPTQDDTVLDEDLPVILVRTPYNKDGNQLQGSYFASHGYGAVVQDTRGRYESEGVWHMLTDDGRDGYDVAQWIGQQPWSNGKIGMYGTSYVGGTQHAMAMADAPHLVTVVPTDAMSNMGYWHLRYGGAFELRFWNWIHWAGAGGGRQSRDPATRAMLEDFVAHRLEYLSLLPLRRGTTPLKFMPEYEEWLVEAMKHGGNDEFWVQNAVLDSTHAYKDIPVYLIGGWYDSWSISTTSNFVALTEALESPVYMIMGPWIHGRQGAYAHGQVSFGEDAAIPDVLAWRMEWYDHWLKGEETSVGRADPFRTKVRIFTMGTGDGHRTADGRLFHGGYWRNENEWPLSRAHPTDYYLHSDGILSPDRPSAPTASTTIEFDPRNPVPTIGGNTSSGGGIMLQGAWDQRGGEHVWNWPNPIPLSARPDVMVFQSPPLGEDLEVTGEVRVTLWASSSALDTDFTAKLIDVYPSTPDFPGGFDMNIGDGIVRARFREGGADEHLMEPGTIYQFEIRLTPTSNVFKRGHRIRVDISSSNYPRFDVNPNTGEPLNEHRRTITALNTLYHDRDHPSHIVLPIIP